MPYRGTRFTTNEGYISRTQEERRIMVLADDGSGQEYYFNYEELVEQNGGTFTLGATVTTEYGTGTVETTARGQFEHDGTEHTPNLANINDNQIPFP